MRKRSISLRVSQDIAKFLEEEGITETAEKAFRLYMDVHSRAARHKAKMRRIKKTGRCGPETGANS